MANRTRGSSNVKGSAAGAKSKAGGKRGAASKEPKTNREVAFDKLQTLTSPILEKYGVAAFDELVNRLENTVKEYTEEVDALFKEMVSQSREDYERMKTLLTGQEPDEAEAEDEEEVAEEEESMSEFEKRLEQMEKEKTSGKE